MGKLQDAVAFRASLDQHLAQLSRLTGNIIHKDNLLSLEETKNLREKAKSVNYSPAWRRTVPFADKSTPRFRDFICALRELNPNPVYLWTPLSNVCGVSNPVALDTIRWGFEFDLIPDGILVLLTGDLIDKLLLDFSEETTGDKQLEIDVSGKNWGKSPFFAGTIG